MLTARRIESLIDVRRFPGSRRHPQFSREALAASLAASAIDYCHEADLGGRRKPRPDSPHQAWRVTAFRAYADYMETREFKAAFARLLTEVERRTTVIMCAEAVPWRCHRRLISDAAVARSVPVAHILAPERLTEHALDANAQLLENGDLLYAGPGTPLPLFTTPD